MTKSGKCSDTFEPSRITIILLHFMSNWYSITTLMFMKISFTWLNKVSIMFFVISEEYVWFSRMYSLTFWRTTTQDIQLNTPPQDIQLHYLASNGGFGSYLVIKMHNFLKSCSLWLLYDFYLGHQFIINLDVCWMLYQSQGKSFSFKFNNNQPKPSFLSPSFNAYVLKDQIVLFLLHEISISITAPHLPWCILSYFCCVRFAVICLFEAILVAF